MFREEHHGGQTTHAIMLPCGGCYESTSTEHRLKPQTPIEYSWPHQLLQIFTNDSTLDRLVIRDVRGEPQQRTRDSYWPSDLSEWHVLRLALQKNSNIKELWFSNNATTRNRIANVINYLETRDDMNEYPKQSPEELKLFLEGLAKNRCIKKLYLHECKFDSCMIEQIGSLLTRSTSVLELHINKCVVDCHDKGLEGLMTLSSYHTLFLNRLQIDDIGMATIINAIIEKKTETMANLDLSRNSSLGINTIASCAKLISNPLSNLRSLTMNESIFDDDKIRMIANALSQNKQSRLERLDLIPEFALPCRVTKVGWNAILEVLCSRSSIEQTYHSNHKLFSLGYTKEALLSSGSPPELWTNLKWNERGLGKKMKIVSVHFIESFNADYFGDMPFGAMPYVLSWIGNDDALDISLLRVMYDFIRFFPDVVAGDHVNGYCLKESKENIDV